MTVFGTAVIGTRGNRTPVVVVVVQQGIAIVIQQMKDRVDHLQDFVNAATALP